MPVEAPSSLRSERAPIITNPANCQQTDGHGIRPLEPGHVYTGSAEHGANAIQEREARVSGANRRFTRRGVSHQNIRIAEQILELGPTCCCRRLRFEILVERNSSASLKLLVKLGTEKFSMPGNLWRQDLGHFKCQNDHQCVAEAGEIRRQLNEIGRAS